MAIAYVTGGGRYQSTNSTTNTLSINFAGGTNTVLIAYFALYVANDATGVTWNGVALTQFSTSVQAGADTVFITGWYLVNPAVGTYNLVGTRSSSNRSEIIGLFYSGVGQTGQPTATNTASGSGASVSLSTTVADAGSWLILGAIKTSNNTINSSTNYSRRIAAGNGLEAGDSNGAPGTGSQSQIVTWGNSEDNAGIQGIFKTDLAALDLTETVTSTDTSARVGAFVRSLTENSTQTDTQSAAKAVVITTSETASFVDTNSTVLAALRSLTESVTPTDTISRTGAFIRSLVETNTLTPSVSSSRVLPFAITESLTLVESVVSASAFIRSLTDTATIVDLSTVFSGVWIPRSKPTSIWTDRTKPTTTWT